MPSRGHLRPLGRASDPAELAGLASAFNGLIARLETSLNAERHFTHEAAHELRTPITVLSGEIEYVRSDAALSDRNRRGLDRAAEQARRMSELVDALLLLRRVAAGHGFEVGERAAVNLGDLAHEVARE